MSSCNLNLDALRSLSEMDAFTDRPLPEACCKSTFDAEWSTQVDLDLTKTYLCSQGNKLSGQKGVLFNQFVNGSVEMIWAKCQEMKRLGYTGKGICTIAVELIKNLKDESKIFLANAQLYDENKGEVSQALNSLSRKIDTLFLQKVVLFTRPELEQEKTKTKSLKELMGVTAQSTYNQEKAHHDQAMNQSQEVLAEFIQTKLSTLSDLKVPSWLKEITVGKASHVLQHTLRIPSTFSDIALGAVTTSSSDKTTSPKRDQIISASVHLGLTAAVAIVLPEALIEEISSYSIVAGTNAIGSVERFELKNLQHRKETEYWWNEQVKATGEGVSYGSTIALANLSRIPSHLLHSLHHSVTSTVSKFCDHVGITDQNCDTAAKIVAHTATRALENIAQNSPDLLDEKAWEKVGEGFLKEIENK